MGYAGEQGLYGIGAGFTDKWCSAKNGGYEADMLVLDSDPSKGAQGCQIYSPYAVAGYLPAASDTIKAHLLALLAAGESIFPMRGGSGDYIMLRKSLLEPGWNQNTHVSMVDFASELFGLSTLWLGKEFWQKYTNHFGESPTPTPSPRPTPTPTPSPRPRPSPSPTPSPRPTPSPIPGGEPSNDCLKCWQAVCSAVKPADCQQCMTDSKDSCIAICKPSLFGQKMRDWFC